MPWPGVMVFVLPPGPVEVEPILFPVEVSMSSMATPEEMGRTYP